MWQYDHSYLYHSDHKYIDKYLNNNGEWVYIYTKSDTNMWNNNSGKQRMQRIERERAAKAKEEKNIRALFFKLEQNRKNASIQKSQKLLRNLNRGKRAKIELAKYNIKNNPDKIYQDFKDLVMKNHGKTNAPLAAKQAEEERRKAGTLSETDKAQMAREKAIQQSRETTLKGKIKTEDDYRRYKNQLSNALKEINMRMAAYEGWQSTYAKSSKKEKENIKWQLERSIIRYNEVKALMEILELSDFTKNDKNFVGLRNTANNAMNKVDRFRNS